MDLLEKAKKTIGDEMEASGSIFGRKKIQPTKFKIIDVRLGNTLLNMKTGKRTQGIQLLLKNDDMKKAKWSVSFEMNVEE